MEQLKSMTNDTSELTSNADDKTIGGMGLSSSIGNSSPNINLDEQYKGTYHPEKTNETSVTKPKEDEEIDEATIQNQANQADESKKTQAELNQQLKEANSNVDLTNDILNALKQPGIKPFSIANILEQMRNQLSKEEFEKARDMIYSVTEPNQAKQWYQGNMKHTLDEAIAYFNQLNNKYTDISYQIRTSKEYDNRTDEQMREDTEVQRRAEDTASAGLNPKLMSIGASGGGSGGTSAKEEEEKKKKKKADEEARKERERQRLITMLLGSIGAIGGMGLGLGNLQLGNANQKLKQQGFDLNQKQMYQNRDLKEEDMAIRRQEAKAKYGKRFNEDETYI